MSLEQQKQYRQIVIFGGQKVLHNDKKPDKGIGYKDIIIKVNHDLIGTCLKTGHFSIIFFLNNLKDKAIMQVEGIVDALNMEFDVQHFVTGDKTNHQGKEQQLKNILMIKIIEPH